MFFLNIIDKLNNAVVFVKKAQVMKFILFLNLLLNIFLITSYAEQINLSGNVEHGISGKPLENVEVYLSLRKHLKTRTDTQGNFELIGEYSSIRFKPEHKQSPSISLNGNSVNLLLAEPSQVKLSIYTVSGKRIYSSDFDFDRTGLKRIFLPANELVSGVYLISVIHKNNTSFFRYMHFGNSSIEKSINITGNKVQNKQTVIKRTVQIEDFFDILVVTTDTTQKARVPVVSLKQSDIKIKLMPIGASNSTPGVPVFTENGAYGDITTYGSPDNPEYSQGGACNYGSTKILYYAAINVHQIPGDFKGDWQNGRACGRCARVSIHASDGSIRSTVVRITDKCPDDNCGIDLGGAPAQIIMGNQIGRYSGEWEWVSCDDAQGVSDGPPALHVKEGSNEWWSLVQVRNGPGGVKEIRVRKTDNTEWITLSMATEAENYYKLPSELLQDNTEWEIEVVWDNGSKCLLTLTGNKLAIENSSYELVTPG